MRLSNKRGMAIVMALFFLVFIFGLTGLFLLAAVHENNMAVMDREMAKAFYAANGAEQIALNQVDILINDFLLNTISQSDPSSVVNFVKSKVAAKDGLGWLVFAVRDNNVAVLTQDGDQALYSGNGAIGSNSYQYTIVMTEKEDPSSVGLDAWDFPYTYTINANGTAGSFGSSITLRGDFTVRVQRDNFAKYALFTNSQTMPSGTDVWFTNKTNFAGPVHTNGRFNFALNPSGSFEESIMQKEAMAKFYNGGWPVLLNSDHNGTADVPVFRDVFNRGVNAITLSSSTKQQNMIDQATGGKKYKTDGIYIPSQGSSLTGGVYVKGDGGVELSVDGNDRPVYTVSQGGAFKRITVDQANNQTTVFDSSTGKSTAYTGMPDGVADVGTLVYVDGNITSFRGQVQSQAKVTVSSTNDIVITNHVMYEEYSPAVGTPGVSGYVPPSADDAENLLGIVSWQGDVRIGTTAPNNIQVHGTVLATNGIFQVDNYDSGSPRGTATLLGGAITDSYGAFGQFNGTTGLPTSGYGRDFVYDQRMKFGQAPPYFPTLNTFIAFSNDITDKMVWQEGD